jgi:hypothetical protein
MDADAENCNKMTRRSYKMKEKWNTVQKIHELDSSGCSCCRACLSVGIPYLYYQHWQKLVMKMDCIHENKEFLPYNTKSTSCRIHSGRKSILVEIEHQLKAYMLNLH